ncbi:Imm48 family immunity protein [Clostridium sp. UBA6640]|uniref:Imm48 family immunity protein n=1 Tax=Clostridium sp. UBA6640 TaxID=1946370 RepID=UPI0025B8EF1E|nr:Imm48 family immunity protein [Clostridium sp. UBA6640]
MQDSVFIKNCEVMTSKLFEVMGIEFEDSTEFDRHILAIFSFGMISAYGMEERVGVEVVRVASQYVLIKVFKYSKEQSETFLQLLIDSTQKGKNPVYYRIIHEGIEMYYEYIEDENDKIFDRIMKMYLSLKKS